MKCMLCRALYVKTTKAATIRRKNASSAIVALFSGGVIIFLSLNCETDPFSRPSAD